MRVLHRGNSSYLAIHKDDEFDIIAHTAVVLYPPEEPRGLLITRSLIAKGDEPSLKEPTIGNSNVVLVNVFLSDVQSILQ